MNRETREKFIQIAKNRITSKDPSHDIHHAMRVLSLAEKITSIEGGDPDIIVPASLFHDLVNYPKNHPEVRYAPEESAEEAGKILQEIKEYSYDKIEKVKKAIKNCSFSKKRSGIDLEEEILRDADELEATGAISIMRTFSSTGSMERLFYNPSDPFCKKREPDDLTFAVDLFFTRLFKVKYRMYTETARKIAERRTKFLRDFLMELELELKDDMET